MATLQIEFNCLCLFVRDEAEKVLHVLMPATSHHHHAGPPSGAGPAHPAHGIEEHLARLVLGDSDDAPKVPLEGWFIELGPKTGAAELKSLDENLEAQIVDVTSLTKDPENGQGRKVQSGLTKGAHSDVTSRFTLRAGKVVDANAEATWVFKEEPVKMAHRVVWEIDDVPDELPWTPRPGMEPPLARLSDLGDPGTLPKTKKSGYRIRVFHTTKDGLPPNDDEGALSPEAVRHHFGVFYEVLGLPDPDPKLLPEAEDVEEGDTVNCGTAQAQLAK